MGVDAWTIYWITRMDMIQEAAIVGTVLSGIAVGIITIFAIVAKADRDEEGAEFYLGAVKRAVVFFFLPSLLCAVFVPTTKQAAAMFVIPAIANNESVREEAGEIYDLAKRWLRSQVEVENGGTSGNEPEDEPR